MKKILSEQKSVNFLLNIEIQKTESHLELSAEVHFFIQDGFFSNMIALGQKYYFAN